jgi:hypothetical protein
MKCELTIRNRSIDLISIRICNSYGIFVNDNGKLKDSSINKKLKSYKHLRYRNRAFKLLEESYE